MQVRGGRADPDPGDLLCSERNPRDLGCCQHLQPRKRLALSLHKGKMHYILVARTVSSRSAFYVVRTEVGIRSYA